MAAGLTPAAFIFAAPGALFVKLNIRFYREKAGLTQSALAILLDIDRGKLCEYEEGEKEPSMEMLMKIAHICHTSTDELFGFSPENDGLEII